MRNHIGTRKVTRKRHPGTKGVPVDNQLIIIPAKPCRQVPVMEPHIVFQKNSLFPVSSTVKKIEIGRGTGIELRRVRNRVVKPFVQIEEVSLETGLPLLPAPVYSRVSLQITFTESTILNGDDGSGQCIGGEMGRVVAHHTVQIS